MLAEQILHATAMRDELSRLALATHHESLRQAYSREAATLTTLIAVAKDASIHPLVPSTPRTILFTRIATELDRAYAKHGRDAWGRHEFYGIIKEEFDEMWADIKRDAPDEDFFKELTQVAAMCFRYFETGDRYRGNHELAPLKKAMADAHSQHQQKLKNIGEHTLMTSATCTLPHHPLFLNQCPVCDWGLAICVKCRKAEADLDTPCIAPETPNA